MGDTAVLASRRPLTEALLTFFGKTVPVEKADAEDDLFKAAIPLLNRTLLALMFIVEAAMVSKGRGLFER